MDKQLEIGRYGYAAKGIRTYAIRKLADVRTLLACSVVELSSTYRSNPIARLTIIGVLSLVMLFIALHVLIKISVALGYYSNPAFYLDVDWSYPEFFGYFLSVCCAVFLLTSFLWNRQYIYLALAIAFIFIALDDSLLLHERGGLYIALEFSLPALPGLRPEDTGELIVWGTVGGVILSITLLGFLSSSREAAGFGAVMVSVLALLLFFAIGIDMLHVAVATESGYIERMLAIVEDGGEMMTLGLAFAVSLLMLLNTAAKRTS